MTTPLRVPKEKGFPKGLFYFDDLASLVQRIPSSVILKLTSPVRSEVQKETLFAASI